MNFNAKKKGVNKLLTYIQIKISFYKKGSSTKTAFGVKGGGGLSEKLSFAKTLSILIPE